MYERNARSDAHMGVLGMDGKRLVLHSGGLDSTVCLLQAFECGRDVTSLGIDYGQRHRIELDYAAAQCRKYGIPRRVIKMEWDKPIREIPKDREIAEIASTVSPAFLPARNLVFLAIACAEAGGVQATEVWIGVNAIDFSGYPDCRPEFIDSFRRMLDFGFPGGPRIVSPLIGLKKTQIAAEAKRLGIHRGDTWSCYEPAFSSDGIRPCERCDACKLHDYAWSIANLGEP